MSEIKPWLEPHEVTVGGQNVQRITEDELLDVYPVKLANGETYLATEDEVINGIEGEPYMGLLGTTPPSNLNASPRRLTLGLAMALAALEPLARAKPNRAERRDERKRQRQARKRGRRS